MLGHRHAASGHHKGRRGGNVKGPGAVTTGSAGVHHGRCRDLNPQSLFAHGLGGSGQFGKGLPLGRQGRHKGTDLRIGDLSGEDGIHHPVHLGLI